MRRLTLTLAIARTAWETTAGGSATINVGFNSFTDDTRILAAGFRCKYHQLRQRDPTRLPANR